jgi:aryl-alcohol dehydrogenase-like predicted oxidoreductase
VADAKSTPDLWLGTWALGGKGVSGTVKHSKVLIDAAYQYGIRHIDTAFFYGNGQAHDTIANAIKNQRSHWHICEKVGLRWASRNRVIHSGSSDAIIHDCQVALRWLRTDYIDTLMLHWPDPHCNLATSIDGLQACVDRGYARHWGLGNLADTQLHHLTNYPNTVYQLEHNCIIDNSVPLYKTHQHAYNLVFSPLANGWLANPNYLHQAIPKSDRRARHPIYTQPSYRAACQDFHANTTTPIEDALRWVIQTPTVHGLILGPRSPEHLHQLILATAGL